MDARRGSFNARAELYHRARPPYPPEVFTTLTRVAGLGPGIRVLEIGAGSGLATAPILATGAEVVAVEPGGELAAILRANSDPARLTIVEDDFERAEVHGDFDLAVSATALHWVDTAVAVPKIGALVRPGGWLAAWWNEFGVDWPTEFRDRLDAVYHEFLPSEPGYLASRSHAMDVPAWTERLRTGGWFGPVEVTVLEWTNRLTPESARLLWSTFPNVAGLDADRREGFLSGLAGIVDDFGGTVDDPHRTVLYLTRRSI